MRGVLGPFGKPKMEEYVEKATEAIIAEKLFKVFKPDMSRYDAQVKAQESARKEMKRELTEQLTEQLSESIMTQARANMEVDCVAKFASRRVMRYRCMCKKRRKGWRRYVATHCDSLRAKE